MADNSDLVEDMIAESTDEEPASRRKVVGATGQGPGAGRLQVVAASRLVFDFAG